MEYKYNDPRVLEKIIPLEMRQFYDLSFLDDLISDLKENGMINPIMLSSLGIPIDGYRRLLAAIALEMDEVPTLTTELEATLDNRAALNNYREFNWNDWRNLFLFLFKSYGNRQGRRSIEKFDRYTEIAKRTKNRFKDKETLKCVEFILDNDYEGFPCSQWLFEKNCDVKSIYDFMNRMLSGGYQDLLDQVTKMELSPKFALALINNQKDLERIRYKSFTLPGVSEAVAEVYEGSPAELGLKLDPKSISLLVIEPDDYSPSNSKAKDAKGKIIPLTPEKFANQVLDSAKPLIETYISDNGGMMAISRETYIKGRAQQIPYHLIQAFEKNGGLFYRQTIYVTGEGSFTTSRPRHRLADEVTQLLWFTKTMAFENYRKPIFIDSENAHSEQSEMPLVYKECTNHMNNQSLRDMITLPERSEVQKAGIDCGAIIPIYITTRENDLVVDMSMKNPAFGATVTFMNRRFIGITTKKEVVNNFSKSMAEISKDYKIELSKSLFTTPSSPELVKSKPATQKVQQSS